MALKNYNHKEWRRRPNVKREKVKFMLEKKIPLIYLEDALKKQIAGPPQFEPWDLIQWITSKPYKVHYGFVNKKYNVSRDKRKLCKDNKTKRIMVILVKIENDMPVWNSWKTYWQYSNAENPPILKYRYCTLSTWTYSSGNISSSTQEPPERFKIYTVKKEIMSFNVQC